MHSNDTKTKPTGIGNTHHLSYLEIWNSFSRRTPDRPDRPRKLEYKRLGLFEVMKDSKLKTRYAYRLNFPPEIQVHPIRHISELEPAANDTYPGQVIKLPPPVEIEGEEE